MFQCDAGQNSLGNQTVHYHRQVVEVAVVFEALPLMTGGVQKQSDRSSAIDYESSLLIAFFQSIDITSLHLLSNHLTSSVYAAVQLPVVL